MKQKIYCGGPTSFSELANKRKIQDSIPYIDKDDGEWIHVFVKNITFLYLIVGQKIGKRSL